LTLLIEFIELLWFFLWNKNIRIWYSVQLLKTKIGNVFLKLRQLIGYLSVPFYDYYNCQVKHKSILIAVFLLLNSILSSQNQTAKWYFGGQAGLDFMTNPPTILTNGAMNILEGCASISNAAGNLLFYTDGITIWTQAHTVMGNGGGLTGSNTPSQSSIIVKQPGNPNLYFVFTVSGFGLSSGCHYSIVDMSLAAGMGSVTVKNVPVYTSSVGEKITGTKHCNGVDYWILIRDWQINQNFNPNFRAYQLTAAGLNTVAVVSPLGLNIQGQNWYDIGCMKISPNGKKLGVASYNNNINNQIPVFSVYDFDNSTGVVSNPLALMNFNNQSYSYGYGCEFSPDGTKFYGSMYYGGLNNPGGIYQWNLCAGSSTAIIATQTTIGTASNSFNYFASLQLAPNGKIYAAYNSGSVQAISVINNPNVAGAGCNFVFSGQSIAPRASRMGLPNFIGSYFSQPPPSPPFTYSANNSFGCQTASFTAPPSVQNFSLINCSASGYSLTGVLWNFGDPASGAANTSTLTNPAHAFTNLGTYTTQLILYYSCGGGTDTLKQQVIINQPCISVNSTSITCANLGSATVAATGGIGPFSYTWMPSGQTNSVATGLSPGTYTLSVFDFGNNFTYTATTVFTSLIPLTGNLNHSGSITCNGASTGTANYTNINGGTANQNYAWSNGIVTYTTPFTNSLSAGIWSATVTDALTGCTINDLFLITQPTSLVLNLSSNTATACAGSGITLSGISSGGTPGYTYSWTAGAASDSMVVSQMLAGTYVYTLTAKDTYSCSVNNTISVDFIPNPVLLVPNASICPFETGTLSVSGASSYTWSNNSNATFITDNPLNSQMYSVSGNALGCVSTLSAYIIVKPPPNTVWGSNSPVCNGQNLNLNISQAVSYSWTGPLGFTANTQNPVITSAAPNQSGVYNVTVTGVNSCTAATSGTVTVNPTPTISVSGSTVCVNQILNLSAVSFPGSVYSWSGPNGFISSVQNPAVQNPPVSSSGMYTVVVSSAEGCTNSAIADVTVTALPVPTLSNNSPVCLDQHLYFTSGGGDFYNWSGPNSFNSNQQHPSLFNATLPANGIYTLVVSTGPCAVSRTTAVTVHPLPLPVITSNAPVCETKKLNFGFTNPNITSAFWQGPSGFTSSSFITSIDSALLMHSGVYTLSLVDIKGCSNTATMNIGVLPNPTLVTSSATVCLNESAIIKVSGAASYYWTGPFGYYSASAQATVPKSNSVVVHAYTVTGTAANNCTAVTTASVKSLGLPVPGLKVSPSNTLCLNKTLTMEGYGGEAYKWAGPANLLYEGKEIKFVLNSPYYAGIYTLTVIDKNACKSQTLTSISINDLPRGSLLGDVMEGCVPFCSEFRFNTVGSTADLIQVNWEVKGKKISGKTFPYCFSEAGTYTFTGLFKDTTTQCESRTDFYVEAFPKPIADFNYLPENAVENAEPLLLLNTSKGEGIDKWDWSIDLKEEGVLSSQHKNTSCLFSKAGTYPVVLVVENKWSCSDTVVKAIKVEEDFVIYVPDVFTPNGDGLNEEFLAVGRGIRKFELQIFNRWGNLLFESDDINRGWDGNYREMPCKQDVYIWKIYVTNGKDTIKDLTGKVTLIR
jgi:gliding motility-associated-like protein